MNIWAQTWLPEHISPDMITWAYQLKHDYMSIPAQTWLHQHISPNMITSAYQPKYDYMSISAQTWFHEHQPKHAYMSISAQTWLHEHISPNMITWAYQPKHDYMNISAQTCVHEHMNPNMITWAYQPFLKGPDPSYPVLKFGNNLSSRNRDKSQSVILYSCDLEKSRSSVRSKLFCTAIHTLDMSIHVKFDWDPTGSFSGKLAHNLPKSGQEKEEERKKEH